MGAQPRGARGTIGHPFSALNLRLAAAIFGLVTCGLLSAVAWRAGEPFFGIILGLLAVVAVVDIVIIQRRRGQRRRRGERHPSLFE